MRIFLLEDHKYVAESLIRAMELRGFEIDHYSSLAAADGVDFSIYRLAILDFNLPDGLGTSLLPTNIPTAVYSGLPQDVDVGGHDVVVFGKEDPVSLIDWVMNFAKGES